MTEIHLRNGALEYLIAQAELGYEVRFKEERIGFLLGRRTNGTFHVTRAEAYRGGKRTRLSVSYDPKWYSKRGETLAKSYGLALLGGYHSHVESGGKVCRELTAMDRLIFHKEPWEITVLVIITASDTPNHQPSPNTRSLYFYDPANGYRYLVKGYAKKRRMIRQVRISGSTANS